MKRIKRNKRIESSIKLAKLMCLVDFKSSKAQLYDWIREYKETSADKRLFDNEQVDALIEAFEELPGYSPERFLLLGAFLGAEDGNVDSVCSFDNFLAIGYALISMVIPDRFDGEAFDGRVEIED